MVKQSGIGASLLVAEYDISGDVGAITSAETRRSTLDVTAIDKSAVERITGLRDGSLGFASFWNITAGQAEPVLSALPTTDRICTVFLSSTLGDAAASIKGKQLNYAVTRGQDGSLGASTDVQANGLGMGLEWGVTLTTGKETRATGTVNGTGVDGTAQSTYGWAAYLHVISIASGTMGVKLQDSTDDNTYNDLTGGGFTNVTAATSERIAGSSTATVERYVRLTTTGVHGNAVVVVNFVRYTESVTA